MPSETSQDGYRTAGEEGAACDCCPCPPSPGARMAAPTVTGVPLPQRSPPVVKTPISPHCGAPAAAAPRLLVTDTRKALRSVRQTRRPRRKTPSAPGAQVGGQPGPTEACRRPLLQLLEASSQQPLSGTGSTSCPAAGTAPSARKCPRRSRQVRAGWRETGGVGMDR